jgi:catechol 2,3-dioxygenase-like lactoylglutathione lyase family enzyme
MEVQFIGSIAVITPDTSRSRSLYLDALGLSLETEPDGYLHSENIDGSRSFGAWPLTQAAQACFGTPEWPADRPVPQASIEFEVADAASVQAAAEELSEQGFALLHQARLPVALPPEQAIELFTPEGERKWSEGWNPVYPRPERPEGPGAVFVTSHDGHTTTWTMVDHTARCVRYARVTPGVAAGTVTVALEADGAGGSRAQVTYDPTSLSADGDVRLAEFDRAYDADVGEWETAIAEALASGA